MNDFKDLLAELSAEDDKRQAKITECRLCGNTRPEFHSFEGWKAQGYRVSKGQKAHHRGFEGSLFESCQVELDEGKPPTDLIPWDWREHAF